MPGKSRPRKGKRPIQTKKTGASRPARLRQQPASSQTGEPVLSPKIAKAPATMTKPAAARYPYLATELWTIGILAGILLAVLVVLALVLA